MQQSPSITFRNMDSSESAEARIRQRIDELDQMFDRITSCNVVVEARHRHQHQGKLFHVHVNLVAPGKTIVVGRDPGERHAHEDLHVAIRDAFDAARRQLQDHIRHLRGDTKVHAAQPIGRITQLFPERNYGFLVTETGEEVYMHRNAVVNGGFDRLHLGDRVRYVVDPEEGEKGAQASTVVPV